MIFLTLKPVDPSGKSNNCYNELYARATPKNNNHVLLNKEEIKNPNPNNGPSKIYPMKWYYDDATFHKTDSTNEGKIRTYANAIQFVFGTEKNLQVVTKYISQAREIKTTYDGRVVYVLEFGEYKVVTDPSHCQSLTASALQKMQERRSTN